jgi:hypothetical protein
VDAMNLADLNQGWWFSASRARERLQASIGINLWIAASKKLGSDLHSFHFRLFRLGKAGAEAVYF